MDYQYKIVTPNNDYHGMAGGIRFNKGFAILSEHTLNPDLGRTLDETARMFRDDFGYEVVKLTSPEVKEEVVAKMAVPPQLKRELPKVKKTRKKRLVTADPKKVVEVDVPVNEKAPVGPV